MPVGTILPYTGDLSKIPHGWALCDGTNGTPNLTGRFLQGWGWDDFYNRNTGEYIPEGLPNVTANVYMRGIESVTTEGAFSYNQNVWDWGHYYWGNGSLAGTLYLNASRSSPLYGNSATVQPRSFVVYYIIRIA